MNPRARRRTIPLRLRQTGCLALALLAGACSSGRDSRLAPAAGPMEPLPAVPGAYGDPVVLPPLPVAQVEDAGPDARRIAELNLVDQDLRPVLRSLAEGYGLDFQLDPAVVGRATVSLRNATLTQALDALVLPLGYSYSLQDRVLRVAPTRMQTRIFSLDYVSMSRAGVGTTVIQRRLGATTGSVAGGVAGGGGFGAVGGAGAGTDVITTVSVSDLWEEMRISLSGLLFDSGAAPAPAGAAGINAGPLSTPGGAAAPGAFSQVGEDGRRLILTPMSGTIVVTAPPEKLAAIAAYIETVERSVQRQVLIEAKIVEVALSRRFEFGIDWSLVQRVGNVTLRVGAGSGGLNFAIPAGNGDAEGQVSLVLNALDQQGRVSVLQSPRVSALNNQRAVINATTDRVFFTVTRQPVIGPNGTVISLNTEIVPQQVAVGVTLDVLPQIGPDNTITMNVRPVITSLVSEERIQLEDGTQASAPVIDRRESDSVVRVRDGETIVLGGLITTQQSSTDGGVPGLRSIPGLGRLFGGSSYKTDKRELVIFITPRIIAGTSLVGR